MELKNNFKIAKTTSIQFPEWTAKPEDPETYFKIKKSIEKFGQIRPIIMRRNDQNKSEIIDGRKILKALRELKIDWCMTVSLGAISEEEAKLIYLLANDLSADFDAHALIDVINKVQDKYSNRELANILPYSKEKLEDYEQLYQFDFSIYEGKKSKEIQHKLFA